MVNRSLTMRCDSPVAAQARRLLFLLFLGLTPGLILAAGCTASSDEVRPPRDQFFFPTGLTMSPDQSVLFVGNANSELRYDSGSVVVVDLSKVEATLGDWLDPDEDPTGDCEADLVYPWVLQCNENEFIDGASGVRVGNFSTGMAVQELESGDLRLFMAVRGDPSVTWIDYSVSDKTLSCEGAGDDVPLCDGANRLVYFRDDLELPALSSEPFDVYVDSLGEYAVVTHLAFGAVSLINAPGDGRAPALADRVLGLFEADPNTGISGAVGVAGRQPGSEGDLIYVTSRSDDRVHMLYVYRPADPALSPLLLPSEYFFLDGVTASDDARGIAFNSDGSRAYIVNRDPPSLQIFDTEIDDQGFPRNRFIGAVELCRDAANLEVADLGRGERVFVSCFSSGQVWVLDPRAQVVDATIDVGRGPHAMALSHDQDTGSARLFVGNFLEDTIAVIDVTPGATTENRMVMRLGRSRQTGGN